MSDRLSDVSDRLSKVTDFFFHSATVEATQERCLRDRDVMTPL